MIDAADGSVAPMSRLSGFEDALELLGEARKTAANIVNGAGVVVARAWRKELPRHIEFLKYVLDGMSI